MDALLWQEKALSLLDQTKYPQEEVWFDCNDYRAVASALKTSAVNGEAILASAGAYGYCLAALEFEGDDAFYKKLTEAKTALLESRPDSAALKQAISRMDKAYEEYRNSEELITALLATAVTIHRQDVIASRAMNRLGREIFPDEAKIVLHCRGGVFHTGGMGGPIGILRSAAMKNQAARVFLCENRPGMEGARLIAHELTRGKVPTTLIPDHGAASLMPRQSCDLVLIEGIRAAANGDLLAGPGAYELAISAYFHSIPVYATLFTSGYDSSLPDGEGFPKEDMDEGLIARWTGQMGLPEGVDAWTPKYDMVPNYLITGLMTEKGLIFAPYQETIPEAIAKTPEKSVLIL